MKNLMTRCTGISVSGEIVSDDSDPAGAPGLVQASLRGQHSRQGMLWANGGCTCMECNERREGGA